MGSKISRVCREFNLRSNCVSNCCSDKGTNDVIITEISKHKLKHKHKHKKDDKETQTNNLEVAG